MCNPGDLFEKCVKVERVIFSLQLKAYLLNNMLAGIRTMQRISFSLMVLLGRM